MSVTANDVAIAAVGTTALIGGLGALNGWRDRAPSKTVRAEDRAHERQLAHDERTYTAKRDAYLDMLEALEGWTLKVTRTEPILKEAGADEVQLPEGPSVVEQIPRLV